MLSLLIRRIAYGVMVMAGVVSLVFLLFQGLGDPSRLVMGQTANKATEENIRKELYLDQPRWKQFLHYLNDISPLSVYPADEIAQKGIKGLFVGTNVKWGIKWPYLRRSYQSKRQVTELLREAMPGTALLALSAMLLACIAGIPLGVIAATRKGTIWDTSSLVTAILGISTPSFFMAIIISYVFGFLLSHYTGLSMSGGLYFTDAFEGRQLALANLLLPAITLGIRPMAIITQLTRSAMLDVLGKDYIRTAYAKGLNKRAIIWTHALRNALNPVITAVTGWLAELLAGAFFVEYIFGWQGLGKLTVDALEKLDFPVLMGSVLLSSLIFIVLSLIADILYAWADPRIRLK